MSKYDVYEQWIIDKMIDEIFYCSVNVEEWTKLQDEKSNNNNIFLN
jgi:hypothetical protein